MHFTDPALDVVRCRSRCVGACNVRTKACGANSQAWRKQWKSSASLRPVSMVPFCHLCLDFVGPLLCLDCLFRFFHCPVCLLPVFACRFLLALAFAVLLVRFQKWDKTNEGTCLRYGMTIIMGSTWIAKRGGGLKSYMQLGSTGIASCVFRRYHESGSQNEGRAEEIGLSWIA